MKDNFLGEFKEDNYTITKSYIDSFHKNVRLYHTKFTPKIPQRSICIIHGFGQHSGRFHHIASFFAGKNFEVLLIDLTGFGYSGGPRGCATVDVLQNDVITLLSHARAELPLYLYAHSLGGLVTIKLLLDRPQLNISGCIITSPLLGTPRDRKIPWFKRFIVKQIGDDLEDLIINSMVNPTALTKNNKFVQTIFEDRLMIPFLSIKMAKSILVGTEEIKKKKDTFRYPIIILHGKKDSVTNYQDSRHFIFDKMSLHKKLHLFENGYHELQHDEEKDELLERAFQFLNEIPNSMIKQFGKIDVEQLKIIEKKKSNNWKLIGAIVLAIVFLLFKIKKLKKN